MSQNRPPGDQPNGKRRRYALVAIAVALVVLAGVVVVALVHRGGNGGITGRPVASTPPSSAVPNAACTGDIGAKGTPTADQTALLARRGGFGAAVTGGAGGEVLHVSSGADSGPGSLREAVAGNRARWIVFDKDVTIRLSKALDVCSNKTIDGRGHRVELTGPGVEGLDLLGVSNVILESLTLHDFGDVKKTRQNDTPDAIHLDRSRSVWVDHCDLSMTGDKLIAVSAGSSAVTVSWNHFHDQEQVFQVGNQATAKDDGAETVTVDHNFFDHTGYRNPVVSYGRAHVYNNYYLNWRLYGVRSERVAQLYLQNNIFVAGSNRRATVVTPAGKGCNDAGTRCDDRPGYLRSVGNLLLGGAVIKQSSPQNVFDPAQMYRFTAEPASEALAHRIQAHAGPQR